MEEDRGGGDGKIKTLKTNCALIRYSAKSVVTPFSGFKTHHCRILQQIAKQESLYTYKITQYFGGL